MPLVSPPSGHGTYPPFCGPGCRTGRLVYAVICACGGIELPSGWQPSCLPSFGTSIKPAFGKNNRRLRILSCDRPLFGAAGLGEKYKIVPTPPKKRSFRKKTSMKLLEPFPIFITPVVCATSIDPRYHMLPE
jgi:hypothetical protein